MLKLFILLPLISSFTLTPIPASKSPPRAMTFTAAVYDSSTNQIFTVGGREGSSNFAHSQVKSFNLTSNEFKSIRVTSDTKPKILEDHFAFLNKDRKIIVIGSSSDIFSFDLQTSAWALVNFNGDLIGNIQGAGFTSFVFDGTQQIAAMGGINEQGFNNDLFL